MKRLILLLFVFTPSFLFSQYEYDYEITTLDSFTITAGGQYGMSELRAFTYQDQIHMVYYMVDTSNTTSLIYGIRTESGIQAETVAILTNVQIDLAHNSSFQFDSLGNPHIYIGFINNASIRELWAYSKTAGQWTSTLVTTLGYTPLLVADPDGSDELGFAFWGPNDPNWSGGQITYASHDGESWNFAFLSSNTYLPRTKPSITKYNNKTYVAYGEGHCADTLITKIFVKDNGTWALDYEDIHLTPYGCGSIGGLYTKLGASNDGVYLFYSLRNNNSHPAYIKIIEGSWELQNIDYNYSLTSFVMSPNLVFNENNTAYWVNEANGFSPNMSWIDSDGRGGTILLPHYYHSYWLSDITIKDDFAYIYYWEGSAAWPYGTPVTFKEIKVDLGSLTTSVENPTSTTHQFQLYQNEPNPFDQYTTIRFSLYEPSDVSLQIFNTNGQLVSCPLNTWLAPGEYQEIINCTGFPSGVYYYMINVEGILVTKKMVIANN